MNVRIVASFVLLALVACGDSSNEPGPPAPPVEPEIPRPDYEILVQSIDRAGRRAFFTMAPDGTQVAPFDGVPAEAIGLAPSPDGERIAYLLPTEEGDQHLWTARRDGSDARAVLKDTRLVTHVEWSPDGTRFVAAGSTFEENDDIWVLDVDGTDLVNIAPDPKPATVADRHPTWSPDGSTFAFQSNRGGVSRIHLMDADGSDVRVLMPDIDIAEVEPVWSRTLDLIAFVVPAVGVGFVKPDGSERRVVPVAGNPGRPAWTPDGELLFSADVFGDLEIFVLDSAGGDPVIVREMPTQDLRAVALPYVAPAAWRGFAAPTWVVSNRPGARGIAAGDVVVDGRADLFVLDEPNDAVRVIRSAGSGYEEVGSLDLLAPHRAIAIADVSRDDRADLIVLGDGAFLVWRGDAGGPLAPTTHALGGVARGLVVHDFDLDGSIDVAGIHEGSGTGFRMLVHSSRSFDGELVATLDYPSTFPGPGRATAADVTGDGFGDVVVLTSAAEAPVVLVPGQGDITFAAAVVATDAVSADSDAIPLCVDLDGDRRADLVLLHPGESGRLEILRSAGTSFDSPVTIAVAATSVVAADFDRDGDVDLVLTRPQQNDLVFLRNRGNGVFATAVSVPLGAAAVHAVALDLDGDRWVDVAVVDAVGAVGVVGNRGR
jgi:hypothetical protein